MSALSSWLQTIRRELTGYQPGLALAVPALFLGGGFVVTWLATAGSASVALLGLAVACVGILVGFLFGIPRVGDSVPGVRLAGAGQGLPVNTNLEQVSDWLTKILVGLTLTHLGALPGHFTTMAAYLSGHGLNHSASDSVIVAASVFFLTDGFLFGYLATRLYLTGAFYLSDPARLANQLTEVNSVHLDFAGEMQVSSAAKAAAEQLTKVDRRELTDPEQLGVWAKAQLSLGNPSKALEGYNAAVAQAPERAELRVERAVAMKRAGEPRDRVIRELEAAYRASTGDPKGRRRAVEGLMFNYLYVTPPRGYERVIALGEEYTTGRSTESAKVWLYLSAAWGQKHHYLQAAGTTAKTELDTYRKKALEAVTQALNLDASCAGIVQDMLDAPGNDDDLVDFKDDAQFRAALGRALAG